MYPLRVLSIVTHQFTQMGGLIDCLTKHKMSDYISYTAQVLHEEYILILDEKI